ncbi:2-amino-4-hydroxy-6-hydroxymethyldihydropteridine diphosphokinase [Noviherbaspirillum sp.]|uniref:2-amino-4-hydroxy-6- hydroxymethyldihydropteridine diphosphokinase n=1 Tax=Noviherbaspirillum sp. TaxID=1926288 RepID=UPI002FDF2055
MSKGRVDTYIGIGSNLGDAADNVQRAILLLGTLDDTRLIAQSNLFRTAPVDGGGDDYVNAVAKLETGMPADLLLNALQAIEQDFGRERPFPNAPRTLDLDVLLYAQQRIDTPSLTVPHPRLTQRAFALIPLLQLDPLLAIPGKGPAHQFVPGVAGQAIQKI